MDRGLVIKLIQMPNFMLDFHSKLNIQWTLLFCKIYNTNVNFNTAKNLKTINVTQSWDLSPDWSDEIYVSLTSVWNLLSHKYKDVLMGLNGSKSMLTFFSFPSSVTMVPQYITKPLGGTTTIQTQIKSKTLQMIQIKHLKHILKYWHNL